jgi:hypothetical protein
MSRTKPKKTDGESAPKPKKVDNARALALCEKAEKNVLMPSYLFLTKALSDKTGKWLNSMIISHIKYNKTIKKENSLDLYPEDKYKLSVGSSKETSKKQPNVSNSNSNPLMNLSLKSKLKNSKKKSNTKKEEDKPKKTEKKTDDKVVRKKNVIQVQSSAKNSLLFILNRFFWEICYNSAKNGTKVQNFEDFEKYIYSEVSQDFTSTISHGIVCTVGRLGSSVNDMEDYGMRNTLSGLISEEEGLFKDQNQLAHITVNTIISYFKLLAKSIAEQVWTQPKTINRLIIESTMRILNIGNSQYAHKNNLLDEGDPVRDMTEGIFDVMREVDLAINPPLTEEEKEKRRRNRAKNSKDNKNKKTKKTKKEDKDKEEDKDKNKDKDEEDEDEEDEDKNKEDEDKEDEDKNKEDDDKNKEDEESESEEEEESEESESEEEEG